MLPYEFLNKGHSSFADGRAFVPTEEKKTKDPRKLGHIRKEPKPHRMIAQCLAPRKNEYFSILPKNL